MVFIIKTEPHIGACNDQADCNNNGKCNINNTCECNPGFDDEDNPKDCSSMFSMIIYLF